MRRLFPILAFIACTAISCNKNNKPAPSPAPSPAPNSPPVTNNTYSVSFLDGNQTFSLSQVATRGSIAYNRVPAYQNSKVWYTGAWMHLAYPDKQHYLQIGVSIPIDSSRIHLLQLNKRYVINDSTDEGYVNKPGTLVFYRAGINGSDSLRSETDTLVYFNKVTSVTYIGNHRYDAYEKVLMCDYEIVGEFNIRVKNDLSGQIHVFSNGKYKLRAGVIAK